MTPSGCHLRCATRFRPARRATARLALCALLAATTAGPLHAQWDRERRLVVNAGVGAGLPLALYDGRIDIDRSGILQYDPEPLATGVSVQYLEKLARPIMAWAELAYDPGSRHWLALRGSFGRGASQARYTGGHAPPESFDRQASWWDVSLLGRLTIHETGSSRLYLQGGPTLTHWRLDLGGAGRDAIAEFAVAGGAPPEPVRWSARSWSRLGVMFGAAGELRLSPGVALVGSFDYLSVPVPTQAFVSGDRADLRARTDATLAHLSYTQHRIHRTTLGLSFSWTALRRFVPDPADRVVAALAGRRAAEPVDAPGPPGVQALLAAGDTAGAIAELERLAAEGPEDAAVLGTLGLLLAQTAPTREIDFQQRRRARELLERALKLDPGNPRYFLGIGMVLERAGFWLDAQRVLTRALAAAARRPDAISPAELADAFHRRGRSIEMRVLEFENLRRPALDRMPLNTPECNAGGAFCLNWARPRAFFDAFQEMPDVSSVIDERRSALLREYTRAVELVPGHDGANRGLLGLHARANDWTAFVERARSWAEAAPGDPWAALFLAAGLHWTGQDDEAEALIARALPALDPADRAVFDDLRRVMDSRAAAAWDTMGDARRENVRTLFWAMRDPLLLTSANERRNEHHARVALAELLFGEPLSGVRGWDTDRGDILVRYGRPRTVWQIPRDESLINDPVDAAALSDWLGLCAQPAGPPSGAPGGDIEEALGMGCPLPETGETTLLGGGRWIFWNYDPDQPSFIFEKQLGRTRVQHMFQSLSAQAAEDARELRPETYGVPFRIAGPVAFQLARFRGLEPGTHELEIHARVPVEALAADTLERGLFLIPRGAAEPSVRQVQRMAAADPNARAPSYRVTVRPGIYDYSLEAATPDHAAAAFSRGEVVVGAYSANRVALSDLLLADEVSSPGDAPASHRDLEYTPLRCLAVPADGRLGVIFEIYGLRTDADGTARYRVIVDAGEAPARSAAVRILRGLRNLVLGQDRAQLSWERVIELRDADRAVEWFEVELPGADAPGQRTFTVTVTDLADGESAEVSRTLAASCGG